jgi:hypothetical protein
VLGWAVVLYCAVLCCVLCCAVLCRLCCAWLGWAAAFASRQEQVAKLLRSSASAPLNIFAAGQYAAQHQPLGSANRMVSSSGGSGLAHNSTSFVDISALVSAFQAGATAASNSCIMQVLEQVNVTNLANQNQVHNIVGAMAMVMSNKNRSIAPTRAYSNMSALTTTVNPVASNDQAALQRLYAKWERNAQYREEKKKRE